MPTRLSLSFTPPSPFFQGLAWITNSPLISLPKVTTIKLIYQNEPSSTDSKPWDLFLAEGVFVVSKDWIQNYRMPNILL